MRPVFVPRPQGALRRFASAFPNAWRGLVECAARGRNMRVHLVAGVLASTLAAAAPLAPGERAAILACVGLVIALEAVNTALEAIVDLRSPQLHDRARVAKDAAAGAVLAAAAASVGVAGAVVSGRWSELRAAGAALAAPALAGLALAAVDVTLLARRREGAAHALLAIAGVGLAAGLAVRSGRGGVAGAAVAVGLHAVAAAASRRRA